MLKKEVINKNVLNIYVINKENNIYFLLLQVKKGSLYVKRGNFCK